MTMQPRARLALAEAAKILRFGLVGVLATATYFVCMLIGVETAHLQPLISTIVAQGVATIVTYCGHALYSFRATKDHRRSLPRFPIMVALSLAVNLGTMALFTKALRYPYEIASVAVAIAVPLTNYFVARFWVFGTGGSQRL